MRNETMNQKLSRTTILGALILTLLASGIANAQAPKTTTKRKPVYYTVRSGQVFRVRLESDLSSEHGRIGDTFRSTTVDPVYSSGGVLLIPQGSTIRGVVTNIQRAGRDGKPAMMDVSFTQVTLPNGRHHAM